MNNEPVEQDVKPSTTGVDLLEAIKNYLKLNYLPVLRQAQHDNLRQALHDKDVFYMSTEELTRRLLELYPTNELTPTLVAEWMHELGFSFVDNGDMLLEWEMGRF